ncbi:unnamed protein product, partial [Onchocerca ochengi]|uniref:Uncharacterized protein n=1 Tax=Onchocerca ochengi TaxID=42157 RepID=A0A182EUN0_ONCOC
MSLPYPPPYYYTASTISPTSTHFRTCLAQMPTPSRRVSMPPLPPLPLTNDFAVAAAAATVAWPSIPPHLSYP